MELRLNSEVFRKIALLWNFMTLQRQVQAQVPQIEQQKAMIKFESEFVFNNIQLQIISEEKLLYISDINGFKLVLSHFASVFKQIFSLSSATFRYHDESTKSYLTLFSILTSNLLSFEIHCLHEKLDYFVKADDIIIRLFKLEESLRGFEDLKRVQDGSGRPGYMRAVAPQG